jgi:RNA polymerase sigma-70 factor, ECF subfamily
MFGITGSMRHLPLKRDCSCTPHHSRCWHDSRRPRSHHPKRFLCLLVSKFNNPPPSCIQMRDEQSLFEELFLPHLDAAYNRARWIVERDQDARDVVQEAYIRALKGFSGYHGGNARAWLLTIVRNTAYGWLKQQSRFSKLIPFDQSIHAQPLDEPSSESDQEERVQQLHEALQQLPVHLRDVLMLYEIEGRSYKELASTLNIPIGTVMSRISRARRRLQRVLAQSAQRCCRPAHS